MGSLTKLGLSVAYVGTWVGGFAAIVAVNAIAPGYGHTVARGVETLAEEIAKAIDNESWD